MQMFCRPFTVPTRSRVALMNRVSGFLPGVAFGGSNEYTEYIALGDLNGDGLADIGKASRIVIRDLAVKLPIPGREAPHKALVNSVPGQGRAQLSGNGRPLGNYLGEIGPLKIDEARRNIVVSRRRLLEEEREKQKHALLSEIQIGQVRKSLIATPG